MSRATSRQVTWALAVALAAAVGLLLASLRSGTTGPSASVAARAVRYQCPMHPTMVSDRPGDCPICGMRLVPVEEGTAGPARDAHAGHEETSVGGAPPVEGRATIRISEPRRQLIGVRTAPVERRRLTRTIRTVGRVTYDETRLRHVHTKIAGWVEELHANATGEMVKQGDPLLCIYSPELVASGEEYLLALRARAHLAASPLASVRESAQRLVAAARRRLLLFDLSAEQVAAMERTGDAPTTMMLHAPIGGHIIARNVTQGERIEPGMTLLDIADLRRVWVLADVYEYELPFIRAGEKAAMTLSYLPGRTFEGRISLVYPVLSEATRTVKVRLEFDNPDFMLRPEMYAEVEIRADLGERLAVPESAVITTGTRDIAFVDRGEGMFEPRELRLGVRLPDAFEVLAGLIEGERVVASGNFLVDSESRLKAGLAAAGSSPDAAGHRH